LLLLYFYVFSTILVNKDDDKFDKLKKNTPKVSTWLWLSKTCSHNRCPSESKQMKMIVILFITGKLKHV